MPGYDPRFPTMRTAFDAALRGENAIDDVQFASLLGHQLFAPDSMDLPIPRQHFRGDFGAHRWEAVERSGHIGPWVGGINSGLPLASQGQWFIRTSTTDERWIGLTLKGIEAHTVDQWLKLHASMIGEALRAEVPADVFAKAAMLSGDWCFRIPGRVTDPDDAWISFKHRERGWRMVLLPAKQRPPPLRMRTRLSLQKEIEAARRALGL